MRASVAPFHAHRDRLYGIAYRMLGSKAEAEDMVQETYLRWHQADTQAIEVPEAWLVTTVTRLSIDRLRAARRERETYVGPWLPEPLVQTTAPAADQTTELASDLSMAFLVVLERLGPEERAAFLLREVFDCGYAEIAPILGKSEAACRQTVRRARERMHRERPRFAVSDTARVRLLERFVKALHAEDRESMLSLFAEDATWVSDGGGKAKAARKRILGAEQISRFALGVWRRHLPRVWHRLVEVNGETGLLMGVDDHPVCVISIATDGKRILDVYSILNPDKLNDLPPWREDTV